MKPSEVLERFLAGDRRALARAITLIENGAQEAPELLRAFYPKTGRAHIVGFTGAPGVGKSTLVDKVATEFRRRGGRVGIVAVDPSSPFTGGAVLGDRIRMSVTGDPGVFMRSLAARGHLGGVSAATEDVLVALEAFGFDPILLETVGAGQSEVEVMELAQTVAVVVAPGLGDDVQAIKAGILEIGDVFVVNKADREGADRTAMELEAMLDLGRGHAPVGAAELAHHGGVPAAAPDPRPVAAPGWRPPVLKAVARDGVGVAAVADALAAHAQHLRSSGAWSARERRRARSRLESLVVQRVRGEIFGPAGDGEAAALADAVAARSVDPYTAAQRLLRRFCERESRA